MLPARGGENPGWHGRVARTPRARGRMPMQSHSVQSVIRTPRARGRMHKRYLDSPSGPARRSFVRAASGGDAARSQRGEGRVSEHSHRRVPTTPSNDSAPTRERQVPGGDLGTTHGFLESRPPGPDLLRVSARRGVVDARSGADVTALRVPARGESIWAQTAKSASDSRPRPRGSRFGDVTSSRIVRGGMARIERGRIPSR